jgi:hypothetical protein
VAARGGVPHPSLVNDEEDDFTKFNVNTHLIEIE